MKPAQETDDSTQSPKGPCAILRPKGAAQYTGLSASTLAKRRLRGDRPHFVKLGRKAIGYHIDELDAWLTGCERQSTSQYTPNSISAGSVDRRRRAGDHRG